MPLVPARLLHVSERPFIMSVGSDDKGHALGSLAGSQAIVGCPGSPAGTEITREYLASQPLSPHGTRRSVHLQY